MIVRSKTDLDQAINALAISNTVEFLERKLRTDAVVHELASRFDGKTLRAELSKALRRKPKDLAEAVYPYVLLIALSIGSDKDSFSSALGLNSRYHSWYKDLVNIISKNDTSNNFIRLSPKVSPLRVEFR